MRLAATPRTARALRIAEIAPYACPMLARAGQSRFVQFVTAASRSGDPAAQIVMTPTAPRTRRYLERRERMSAPEGAIRVPPVRDLFGVGGRAWLSVASLDAAYRLRVNALLR